MQAHELKASAARKSDAFVRRQANGVRVSTFLDEFSYLRRRSLDRTEFTQASVPLSVTNLAPIPSGSRVMFRGVLLIQAVTHLSDKGVEYLTDSFRERVTRSIVNTVSSAKKYSLFSIADIFKLKKPEHYQVKILIQGFMSSKASFMRCKSSTLFQECLT